MLIPEGPPADNILTELEEAFSSIDSTYHLTRSIDGTGHLATKVDGWEAVYQAVQKVFMTEWMDWPTYDYNYGIKLKDLIGKPIDYCKLVISDRILTAFSHEKRVTGIKSVTIDYVDGAKRDELECHVLLGTIYGDVSVSMEVI